MLNLCFLLVTSLSVAFLYRLCKSPFSQWAGPVSTRVHGKEKLLALTFDDGPGPDTLRLLDVLERYGVKATFFLIGKQVRRRPEVARRLVDHGHALGNHSDSHSVFRMLTSPHRELQRCSKAILEATGVSPELFRPPRGFRTPWILRAARRLGLSTVQWTLNSQDYAKPGVDALVESVLSQVSPGYIVLLHDGPEDRGQTVEAVERLIVSLQNSGYRFVPLEPWTLQG